MCYPQPHLLSESTADVPTVVPNCTFRSAPAATPQYISVCNRHATLENFIQIIVFPAFFPFQESWFDSVSFKYPVTKRHSKTFCILFKSEYYPLKVL